MEPLFTKAKLILRSIFKVRNSQKSDKMTRSQNSKALENFLNLYRNSVLEHDKVPKEDFPNLILTIS